MSVYNSAALAAAMNSSINNVTGGEITPTNFNGAVNLGKYIKNPRDILINNVTGQVKNGLTIERNYDGTFNVSGTATSTTNIKLYNFTAASLPTIVTEDAYQAIPRGKYLCGISPNGSAVNKYIMSMRYGRNVGESTQIIRIPSTEPILIDNTNGEYNYVLLYFGVWSGQTVNLTVNPYLKKV